jgi:hypothetical protein
MPPNDALDLLPHANSEPSQSLAPPVLTSFRRIASDQGGVFGLKEMAQAREKHSSHCRIEGDIRQAETNARSR